MVVCQLNDLNAKPPHHHNHFTAIFLGLPGWASARRNLLDYTVQGGYQRQTHRQSSWRRSIWNNQRHTSLIPPFLWRIPFLPQLCQFIVAWDRHQMCWLAYSVERKQLIHAVLVQSAFSSGATPRWTWSPEREHIATTGKRISSAGCCSYRQTNSIESLRELCFESS